MPLPTINGEQFGYFDIFTLNIASVALTDFQVKKTIAWVPHMKSDFADLRFTTSGGTVIQYWIESKTDGVTADVWMKIPAISAVYSTRVLMYYGNPNTVSASSITNTMIFGDDFSGDLSLWSGDTGSFSTSNDELNNTPTSTLKTIFSNAGSLSNTIIESRIKTTDGSTDLTFGIAYRIDASNRARLARRHASGNERRWGDASTYFSTIPPQWTSGVYGTDRVIVGTTVANSTHSFDDTTITGVGDLGSDIVGTNIEIVSRGPGTPGTQYIDYIFVRKYTETEPTWAADSGEQHQRIVPQYM